MVTLVAPRKGYCLDVKHAYPSAAAVSVWGPESGADPGGDEYPVWIVTVLDVDGCEMGTPRGYRDAEGARESGRRLAAALGVEFLDEADNGF